MAISNIKQWIRGGFAVAQAALVDSSGYPMGITGTISNGAGAGMRRLRGASNANISVPNARKINVEGDDESQGEIQIPPASGMSYQLAVSNSDQTFQAACQQTNAYDVGKWTFLTLDPVGAVYPDQCHIYSRRARSKVSGSEGPGYENLIVPKLQASYDGPGEYQSGENAGKDQYTITVTKVLSYPWGLALANGNEGTTGTSGLITFSEYPLTMDTYIGDNSTTTYTLTNTPAGTHLTSYIKVWKAGVALTATTDFTVSGSVVTFVAAPAAAAKVVIVYEATTLP